jgi:protein TonB
MSRRLFDDLVQSGNSTARSPTARTLPLSLALHAMALAALATLSATATPETPLRASAVIFHPPLRSVASTSARTANAGRSRPPRPTPNQLPIAEARPPVGLDMPVADPGMDILDAPMADLPICLSGCSPSGSDSADTPGAPGSGATGEGTGPPRRPGGDILEPRRIRGQAPVYSELARRAGVEGKVVVECVIDADGHVTDLRVISGHPLLADAAKEAVRLWVYTPTRLNGEPIRVILTVTVKFDLARNR